MILDDLQEKRDVAKANDIFTLMQNKRDSEKAAGIMGKMEAKSFTEKHPNLYGLYGVAVGIAEAFGKVGHAKYADPYEIKRLAKMSPEQQKRQLLMDTLEDVTMIAFGALGPKAKVPVPKTVKAITGKALAAKFGLKYDGPFMGGHSFTPLKGHKQAGQTFNVSELTGKAVKKGLKRKKVDFKEPMLTPEQIAAVGRGEEITVGKPHQELFDKITTALKEAKPIRRKQEALYSQERAKRLEAAIAAGKRIPGEKGYFEQLRKLKGKLPKVEFESLRGKITPEEYTELFNIVRQSTDVTGYSNITAQGGLLKMLGEQGGRVPTEGELILLRKIFPANLIQALLKKRTTFQKLTEAGLQLANIPRAVMASYDLSAPFRQGIFLAASHPKRFTQAFFKMFKQFGSERAFLAAEESIAQKSTYNLMKEGGLSLTKMGERMALREEAFMSQWAERIPLIGRGVKASGRAHMGFLNKLRADVFEDLVLKAEKIGLDPRNNMDLTKQIAKFVNAASGRGSLGSLERSAVTLNTFFFSPRLMSSRLTLLNPVYYVKADPFVRKEALKSLLTTAGAVGTVLGLAKAGGLEVGTDVRSADFGKIKVGKTRIDIMGGFQQYIRAAGQLTSGQYVSTTTGKVETLGEGYRPLTRLEILYRQVESKEAPIFSFITQMLKGRDIKGEKLSIPKEVADRFIPMALRDVYDIAQEDPTLLPISVLGFFGVGLQTYGETPKIPGGIEALGGIEGMEIGP